MSRGKPPCEWNFQVRARDVEIYLGALVWLEDLLCIRWDEIWDDFSGISISMTSIHA